MNARHKELTFICCTSRRLVDVPPSRVVQNSTLPERLPKPHNISMLPLGLYLNVAFIFFKFSQSMTHKHSLRAPSPKSYTISARRLNTVARAGMSARSKLRLICYYNSSHPYTTVNSSPSGCQSSECTGPFFSRVIL